MDGARIVAQRYRLDESVGAGGMGEVWRATDLELRRVVALKKSQAGDGAQIRREARIGAGLHHPHVVTVFDAVTDGADRWLVMEYLPARDLNAVLRADGPLPPAAAARVVAQIADAVAAMHAKGMVHRDIKPGNVLVTEDGTAKLTDLGIARWAEVTRTHEAEAGGTPGYLAPEVADGADADARADVFALGATLFAAATGHSPWGGPEQGPFAQLHRARKYQLEPLPDNELKPALQALLARDPAARPSATQAHHGLAALVGDSVSPIAPLGSGERTPTVSIGRKRGLVVALSTVLALLLVAGVVLALRPPAGVGGQAVAAPGRQVDAVGDPHTFDPCSVLMPEALTEFGQVQTDHEYGGFNECGLVTQRPNGKTTYTSVLFSGITDELTSAPLPGRITTYNYGLLDGLCKRIIVLPTRTQLTFVTKYVPEEHPREGDSSLCTVSDRAMTSAMGVLSGGALPRMSHPANSTALVDACSLLSARDLAPVFATAPDPSAGFGAWSCDWGNDGEEEVSVAFGREWELANPDPDIGTSDKRVPLAGKQGFKSTDDDSCTIRFSHRGYTDPRAPFGEPGVRDETVAVSLTVPGEADLDRVCATAVTLANATIPRLPR